MSANFISRMAKTALKCSLFFLIAGISTTYAAPDNRCAKILSLKAPSAMKARSELNARFLKSHNDIRAIYSLANLVWDRKLASYAQQWAEHLKFKNKCQMMHRSEHSYGENLAMNWTSKTLSKKQFDKSPEFAVQNWAKECKDYSPATNKCQAGKQCGHFTQVAWRDSQKVGCGMVTCDGKENPYGSGRVELWVCNYDPPGNFIGRKPF